MPTSAEAATTRLGLIGSMLTDPLLVVERGGRILDLNDAAARLLGGSAETLTGRRLAELVRDSTEHVDSLLATFSRSRELVPGRLTLDSHGGGAHYRCDGGVVRPEEGGEPAVVLLRLAARASSSERFQLLADKVEQLGREVGARLRAEALLDAQRRSLEMILLGAPLPDVLDALVRAAESHSSAGLRASILLLDEDGRHLRHGAAPSLPAEYNRAIDGVEIGPMAGACGTAAFLGQPVTTTDVATDPRWEEWREMALGHGLRACASTPIASREGTVLGTVAVYYPEPRAPGARDQGMMAMTARIAAIAIERDREHRRIEQLLASEREARTAADAANRAKDDFLALISHELRNPLNAMLGWTRLLLEGDLDAATRRRGLQAIERNAELQAQLISDVLDFARITAGQLRLELETVDLRALVRDFVESMRPQAEKKSLELAYAGPPAKLPLVCDPDRLQQVVGNLLSNAIKFTPAGGRVAVRLEAGGGEAAIAVEDTGEGIEPAFLPHVFERFRQADSSPTRQHQGLGLGLAVVRSIAEMHGGRVEAASEGPGRGARFVVHLPLDGLEAPAAPTRAHVATPDLAGLRVLVVDDQEDARDLVGTVLGRAGARVLAAASAAAALELLEGETVDVVVSDIAMPGLDGYGFVRELRARAGPGPRVPAAALTAHARDADRERAIGAGYDAYLAKPIDPDELAAAVAALAGRKEPRGRPAPRSGGQP